MDMNFSALIVLARRIGPQALRMILKWGPVLFDKGNRQRLEQVSKYLKSAWTAQQGRSKSQRLRRTLKVIIAQAHELEQRHSDSEAYAQRARQWGGEANALLGAVELLAVRSGAQRRAELKRIGQNVDALFAAVMEATMTWTSPRTKADEGQDPTPTAAAKTTI
jgi:hypothetical protein